MNITGVPTSFFAIRGLYFKHASEHDHKLAIGRDVPVLINTVWEIGNEGVLAPSL